MIILEAKRPARGKRIFDSRTERGAPACFAGRVDPGTEGRHCADRGIPVVRDRRTTLYVEQCAIPSITNLARKQAETIDLALIDLPGELEASIAAFKVSPVALRFEAEHPGRHLPAIPNLTADCSARCAMAAFVAETVGIPVDVAAPPSPVDADVETAPVVSGLHNRGSLRISTR